MSKALDFKFRLENLFEYAKNLYFNFGLKFLFE
jgi:hypothetical protein